MWSEDDCRTVVKRRHVCVCPQSRVMCPVAPLLVLPFSIGLCGKAVVGVHSEKWTWSSLRPAAGARYAEHRASALLVICSHLGTQLPHRHAPAQRHPHHGLPQDPPPPQPTWEVCRRGESWRVFLQVIISFGKKTPPVPNLVCTPSWTV